MKKEFFNTCADKWRYPCEEKYKLIEKHIIALLELKQTDIVLDACCGTGVLIPLLKGKCAEIVALDYSINMLNKAEEINRSAAVYVEASIENTYCADEEFDKIICHNAFPHIDDKQKAFNECFRILKQDGIFVISHDRNKEKINGYHKKCQHAVCNDVLPSNNKIIVFASNAGFKTIEIYDEENYFATACKK
ncbi:MAG: class I SAM-dependent methyltransferase [Endomicrobium sp.]|jgi:demethylmenaquinone methyltransferase/2-methoxy-6-polyprenyl-1,4-benzoquinol methylase|nr:class I SAM-dependent methyltransferase [Endomicrobium sp.]